MIGATLALSLMAGPAVSAREENHEGDEENNTA